jgi:hypothetical protein
MPAEGAELSQQAQDPVFDLVADRSDVGDVQAGWVA